MLKKQIHVITKYFYPVAAGIETNILETYSVLASKGWDVVIHTSNDQYLKKNSLPKSEIIRGLKIQRYAFSNDYIGFTPLIDYSKADLICLHNFNVFFWRIFLHTFWLKITGQKKFALVLTPHGGFNPEWSIFDTKTKIIKVIYHYVIGTIFINLLVDKVRAVSEWERREIINKGVKTDKVDTISNGLEDEAFMNVDKLASPAIKKLTKQSGKYIIQVGRIYKIKNYETTIRSLVDTPDNLNFVIVGQDEKSTEYKEGLIKLAKTLGLEKRVFFVGVVRGIDKYYLIKHAVMMVHMAIWESYCNVVHEGLSQGLICIVSNAYALPFLIKDGINGFLVNTFDTKTLSNRINYVLNQGNSDELIRMKTNNKKLSQNDSWRNVAGRMDLLYKNLLF